MEEDSIITEERLSGGEASGSSGNLKLDGEAWKDRDSTTYTSLLDRYDVAELFSENSMDLYRQLEEESQREQDELTEYIFSGQMQTKSEEENMVERIFAEEIQLTKTGEYSREETDYSICYILAEILFVLVFLCILMKAGAVRKKRREAYAVETDMEDQGTTGYGASGI